MSDERKYLLQVSLNRVRQDLIEWHRREDEACFYSEVCCDQVNTLKRMAHEEGIELK